MKGIGTLRFNLPEPLNYVDGLGANVIKLLSFSRKLCFNEHKRISQIASLQVHHGVVCYIMVRSVTCLE